MKSRDRRHQSQRTQRRGEGGGRTREVKKLFPRYRGEPSNNLFLLFLPPGHEMKGVGLVFSYGDYLCAQDIRRMQKQGGQHGAQSSLPVY